MKSITEKINESVKKEHNMIDTKKIVNNLKKEIYNLEDEEDDDGWNMRYLIYGDVEDFNYSEKEGVLTVYATGKAFGDSSSSNKEITKKDWDDFDKTSYWKRNYKGKKEPVVTNEHGAVLVAKKLKKEGLKINKIYLNVYND